TRASAPRVAAITRWRTLTAMTESTAPPQPDPVAIVESAVDDRARRHEQRLTSVLEQLPISVGVVHPDGSIMFANGLFRLYMPDGNPALHVDQERRWRALRRNGLALPSGEWPIERALRGEHVPGIDFLHALADGREIWLRISATPFRDDANQVIGAIVSIEDVDARRRAEQALRTSEAKARARTDELEKV